LNAIEPTWFWLKRNTTRKGAPKSKKQAYKIWAEVWKELPQKEI
jgi:hypothetical protein